MSETIDTFDLDISWHEIENEIKYIIKIDSMEGVYTKEAIHFFKEFKRNITQLVLPYFTENEQTEEIEESTELSQ